MVDFALSETHQTVAELADRILGDASADGEGWFDRTTWSALADAGLLGIALAEDVGGGGLDFLAAHVLLESHGRHVASVPLWEQLVGTLAVDAHASDGLRRRVLPGLATGERVLTVGLVEEAPADLDLPATNLVREGERWRLAGRKILVPIGTEADLVLVSARTESDEPALALADLDAAGVTITTQRVASDVPHAILDLDDVALDQDAVLAAPDALSWTLGRARAGLAAMQAGICAAAIGLAASYTSEREQFGRAVATFQAVSQRVADAQIQAEGVRLTALEASWRLADGLPAGDEIDVAGWWAAAGADEVLRAVHHVHGGVGVDEDYPLSRYSLRARQHEFALGTASDHLAALGASLAAAPVP